MVGTPSTNQRAFDPSVPKEERGPLPAWWNPATSESNQGNLLALKHGAHSPRLVEPIAAEYAAVAVESLPFLADPSYAGALRSWARTEARIERIENWLQDRGDLDDEGNVRPATEMLIKLKRLAIKERAALGLDAMGRIKIGTNLAALRKAARFDPNRRKTDEA